MNNNKTPLYEKIFHHYKKMILSGELPGGTRLPSENAIMQTFGVSRITASRAFKELELAKLIRRIKGSGSYVK
ncbi:MAG: winged helix-turn-helix transcriptional regulator, partial [Clostridia bacterium]|nr:winged helix-turn-helix transcriptional regulator [Clostridia bacterium]